MADASRVSVVIPCWRCASTLPRAVGSVLSQTVKPLEVILVDDGNVDETPAVLRELAAQSPTLVRVVSLAENRGPGGARNAGWDAARGDLIAFLDADDAWHPRKLELHLGWLSTGPQVVMSGHKSMLCSEGVEAPRIGPNLVARRAQLGRMLISNPFQTRTVIIRRDVRLRFAGRYSEDLCLWLQLVASGAPCYVLDAPLACIFRPEFSTGGMSSALWMHEKGELAALAALRRTGGINGVGWVLASGWSLAKFVRRVVIRGV